ncbi:MAG: hypothetical protein ACRD9R_21825 [Pyrinomonadaceae bacterium]
MTQDFLPTGRCPKCGTFPMRAWGELDDAGREIARGLYTTGAAYPLAERAARHRWCTTCWHEETGRETHSA